jgi:hypothetical protein
MMCCVTPVCSFRPSCPLKIHVVILLAHDTAGIGTGENSTDTDTEITHRPMQRG